MTLAGSIIELQLKVLVHELKTPAYFGTVFFTKVSPANISLVEKFSVISISLSLYLSFGGMYAIKIKYQHKLHANRHLSLQLT